jgi:hypothetical protein
LDVEDGLLRDRDSTNEFLSIAAEVRFSRRSDAADEVAGRSPQPRFSSRFGSGNGGGKKRRPNGGRGASCDDGSLEVEATAS